MKLKSALSALAAASFVVAPLAAQAGTTASKSVVSARALSSVGERRATNVAAKENLTGVEILALVAALVAAGVGAYAIIDDNGETVSYGVS